MVSPSTASLFVLLFIGYTSATPVDNGIVGDPEIECGATSISINVNARNNFEGHVYVKGRYAEPGCKTDATNRRTASIELPFDKCGVQRERSLNPRGVFVTTTVIVSFHPMFETKVDRAIKLKCFYMEADKTVTQDLQVSMLSTSLASQQVPMPQCRYEVLQGGPTGSAVKFATVGQPVYHKWTCDTQAKDIFCMQVYGCYVDDGKGEKVPLLDDKGCSQDKYLLGNVEYNSDLGAGKEAHVFKYADRPQLFFNCQIRIAIKEPHQQCQKPICTEPQRGKRLTHRGENRHLTTFPTDDTSVLDVSSSPISVVDVDNLDELQPNELERNFVNSLSYEHSSRLDANDICLSTIGFITMISAGAIGLLISLSIAIAMCTRSPKKRQPDTFSVYSGSN